MKKARFTFIDLLIILVIVAAAVLAVWKVVPQRIGKDNTTAVFTVMLTEKDTAFLDAIHIDDAVSISNKEKDGGIITKIEAKDAESLQFNSIKGEYILDQAKNKKDIFVTIEADASESGSMIQVGSTPVKVGLPMPVRGKGYASMGYVVNVSTKGGAQE